ncbi:MAG: NgoPII family restriction endonuclease, partial [Candidatus Methanosuratincola petrocarbonis]
MSGQRREAKDRLHRDDPRITERCRMAEGGNWGSKDLFYAVGCAKRGELKHLFFVHGRCYAAERGTYDRIALKLKRRMGEAIAEEGLEAAKTSEI